MGHRLPRLFAFYSLNFGQEKSDFEPERHRSMQITRATDYAVRIMVYLAMQPHERKVPLSELADAGEAPESFASKVLQRLALCGLVNSSRGRRGGFQLARRAETTSLLQVVEAMEGPLQINLCLSGEQTCDRKSWCAVHPIWARAQQAMLSVLRSASIADLAAQTALNKAQPAAAQ